MAVADADRARTLGFDDAANVVLLSAATVATHPRFANFTVEDWLRIQRIVDDGDWRAGGANHRLLWIDEDGKPWLAVLKRTAGGKVYLQSYRRARRQEIENRRTGRTASPGGHNLPRRTYVGLGKRPEG